MRNRKLGGKILDLASKEVGGLEKEICMEEQPLSATNHEKIPGVLSLGV